MSLAGLQPKQHLAGFVDPEKNYRIYRAKLHVEPCLPFLYPLVIDLKRSSQQALKAIFSFQFYHEHLQRDLGQPVGGKKRRRVKSAIFRICTTVAR